MTNPFVKAVTPKVYEGDLLKVVILDRIEPGKTPEYCIHGRVTCYGGCGEWLWLGDKTHDLVANEGVTPLCVPCAEKSFARDTEGRIKQIGNAGDSLRSKGHD